MLFLTIQINIFYIVEWTDNCGENHLRMNLDPKEY